MKLRGATASAIAAQKIAQGDYGRAQAEASKWKNLKSSERELASPF